MKNLNPQQLKAATFKEGPLLIVAGAGTGKTTVITQRISHLIDSRRAKSDEILALTFTDKASQEMQERLDMLLPYGYVDMWAHTFHSFSQRILESYGIDIGLPNAFKLLNQTEQWILLHNNILRLKLDYYRPLGNPTKFLHALLKHFSRLKDEAITPKEYLEYAENLRLNSDSAHFLPQILSEDERDKLTEKEVRELKAQEIKKTQEVADAYHSYQEFLLENNSLDFGDLINYCLKLFRERPKILAKFRSQFKYILVDEFQDTNWAQYELIKLLSAPKNNLTVCGDDDQSIYKFRGASVSNILQFKKDFPGAEQVYLIKNYRSCQNILDLSYNFIQHNNPNRLEVTLDNEKNFSKKLIAQSTASATIEYFEVATHEDEMKAVISKILELKTNNADVSWSDFAILVRANSHADIFNYGLSQKNIPYQYVASRGLYNKPIILDMLSYLKLLDNYHESPALFRIASLPIFQFTQRELINFNYWAKRKGRSLYQILSRAQTLEGITEETVKKAQKVIGLIEKQTKMVGEKSVKELLLIFLEESGYLKEITRIESQNAQLALSYLNQFYRKISEYEAKTHDPSVKNFLHIMELEIEAGEEGSLDTEPEVEGPDSVKVMTIHAAKGLEFKYVFIANLVDRRFPTTERKEPIEIPNALVKEIIPTGDIHLQEERRLMYVACTRAKLGLYLTGAKNYGGTQKKKPSVFVKEMGLSPQASSPFVSEAKATVLDVKGKREFYKMPERFSFSQLKAYENCPWQYRYAFILRVPVKGKPQFSFGKTIHLVMQKMFERILSRQDFVQGDLFGERKNFENVNKAVKEYISPDEVVKIYEECFIDDWYRDEAEKNSFYEKGKKILKEYYAEIENEIIKPKHLEKSFSIKIFDDTKGSQYSLFGVIDRIDEKDGGLEIIDYKTGKGKKALQLDNKEQLLIYQMACQEIFQKPIKSLTFLYVEENSKQTFIGAQKDLDTLKEKIISAIHEIEKGEFKPKPSVICKYCDFRDICDFRQL